ncbi:MAG: hypothetical protein J7K62_03175 [Thermoplasmata archaeon]|nr:hypothetical protein [Thermoplasmata archaeon]
MEKNETVINLLINGISKAYKIVYGFPKQLLIFLVFLLAFLLIIMVLRNKQEDIIVKVVWTIMVTIAIAGIILLISGFTVSMSNLNITG